MASIFGNTTQSVLDAAKKTATQARTPPTMTANAPPAAPAAPFTPVSPGGLNGALKAVATQGKAAADWSQGFANLGANATQQQQDNTQAMAAQTQRHADEAQAAYDADLARDPTTIDNQMGYARSAGNSMAAQGNTIYDTQAGLGQKLATQAGAYTANAQGDGFKAGTRATAGAMGGVQNVAPSALGGYGSVAGGLGGAPGAVSTGSLGNVGMTAGRLGAAPQVGSVGNIQTGAGPGAVAGTLGNQGASSLDQQGMLGRLNGFLDAPEGPSVAQSQLQQAQAQNMSQMLGMARSGRGGAGAQAQALAGAMSEGGAIASDTAGQLATLRAQEEDMRKNRALSAIGLGGDMATAARGQDLGFRGQELSAAQGDQSAQLAGRGQDIQAAMSNQSTQTQLEQLRASTALGARGQNLSALQGDQGAALGMRGQNLSALQGNQSTALGARGQNLDALSQDVNAQIAARGQNLSALQGNQQTGLAARGQNITQEANVLGANTAMRGQDLQSMQGNADRNLAAQNLTLQGKLGLGELANTANGQGLQFLSQANQQAMGGEQMAQDALNNQRTNLTAINNANVAADTNIAMQNAANTGGLSFEERLWLGLAGGGMQAGGQIIGGIAASDREVKTDIAPLDALGDHLRNAPGYRYRYKPGIGEDTETEHAGPMAQDLEKSPFGKSLVKRHPVLGHRMVDTTRLTLVNHAALASMRSELDRLKAELAA